MSADRQVIEALRHSEKRYHLFKAALILFSTVVIVGYIGYQAHRTVDSINAKNQQNAALLRCALVAFEPQNYRTADKAISKCLDK